MNVRELINELEKIDDDELEVIASPAEEPDCEILGVELWSDDDGSSLVAINLGREV